MAGPLLVSLTRIQTIAKGILKISSAMKAEIILKMRIVITSLMTLINWNYKINFSNLPSIPNIQSQKIWRTYFQISEIRG